MLNIVFEFSPGEFVINAISQALEKFKELNLDYAGFRFNNIFINIDKNSTQEQLEQFYIKALISKRGINEN